MVVFACLFASKMELTGTFFSLLGVGGDARGKMQKRRRYMGNFSERQEGTATLHRHRCRVRDLDQERPSKGSEDGVHVLISFGIRGQRSQKKVYFPLPSRWPGHSQCS